MEIIKKASLFFILISLIFVSCSIRINNSTNKVDEVAILSDTIYNETIRSLIDNSKLSLYESIKPPSLKDKAVFFVYEANSFLNQEIENCSIDKWIKSCCSCWSQCNRSRYSC